MLLHHGPQPKILHPTQLVPIDNVNIMVRGLDDPIRRRLYGFRTYGGWSGPCLSNGGSDSHMSLGFVPHHISSYHPCHDVQETVECLA